MFSKTDSLVWAGVVLLVVMATNSYAQDFSWTNLSSDKPFYSNPPYQYEGSEHYFINFKTSPEVVKSLVPEPLVAGADSMAYLFLVKHKVVAPAKFDYYEVYFTVPVSFGEMKGTYIPVLYLDKTEGITPGREIWGYNKINADIHFEEENENVTIKVTRNDTTIMRAAFTLAAPFPMPEQTQTSNGFAVKYIPSCEKGAPPDVHQIVNNPFEYTTSGVRLGKATLEFFSTKYDPLHKIPIIKITQAGYAISSFTLDYGKVVYDYLDEE